MTNWDPANLHSNPFISRRIPRDKYSQLGNSLLREGVDQDFAHSLERAFRDIDSEEQYYWVQFLNELEAWQANYAVGGGSDHILVASADYPDFFVSPDFVCDGVADQEEIQAAAALAASQLKHIKLGPGVFNISGSIAFSFPTSRAIILKGTAWGGESATEDAAGFTVINFDSGSYSGYGIYNYPGGFENIFFTCWLEKAFLNPWLVTGYMKNCLVRGEIFSSPSGSIEIYSYASGCYFASVDHIYVGNNAVFNQNQISRCHVFGEVLSVVVGNMMKSSAVTISSHSTFVGNMMDGPGMGPNNFGLSYIGHFETGCIVVGNRFSDGVFELVGNEGIFSGNRCTNTTDVTITGNEWLVDSYLFDLIVNSGSLQNIVTAATVSSISVAGGTLTDNGTGTIIHDGEGDKTYKHVQSTPSASWVVTHGLGKRPSVDIIDSTGEEVEAEVVYDSDTQVTINFNGATSGEAYFN